MPRWQRNLIVLCIAQLFTQIGFSAYQPFMPYFVQELGVSDYARAAAWIAMFDSGMAVAMMICAPIWGALADRYGRKVMVVRATGMGAVTALIMGLATAPGQLVVLRIMQGAFCGSVAAANVLVATDTPEDRLGQSLGIMQTTQYVGMATGPLVGGALSDWLGYRPVFAVSAGVMAVAALGIILLVRERFTPQPARVGQPRLPFNRKALTAVAGRNTMILLVAMACNHFGIAVLSPTFSLYVKSLSENSAHLGTLAGSIVSATALTSAASALLLGRVGDRFGRKRVLVVCVLGAALTYAPQALVANTGQLLVLRAVLGLFMGGLGPAANALLASSTAADRRGTVFGLASSMGAGGGVLGPMLGATVAGAWGLAAPFWVTASILLVIAGLIAGLVREQAAPAAAEAKPASAVGR